MQSVVDTDSEQDRQDNERNEIDRASEMTPQPEETD
jgi:hypothetical protein